jgi:putative oxidoreductase
LTSFCTSRIAQLLQICLGGLSRRRLGTHAQSLLRWAVGIVLILSALPKLQAPQLFLAKIFEYELLGPTSGTILAMVIPLLELVLAACLLGGVYIEGALFLAVLLFGAFLTAESSAVWRGLEISCGCFSLDVSQQAKVSYVSLARTACLLLLVSALFALRLRPERKYPALAVPAGMASSCGE